jgi:hypothetical protein
MLLTEPVEAGVKAFSFSEEGVYGSTGLSASAAAMAE